MVEKSKRRADLFWSLPALVGYKANTELPVTVSAVNLTDVTHQYMLRIKTFDGYGRQITQDTFTVDGLAWFELEAGDRIDSDGSIMLEETNATLGIFLIERETEEEVDSVFSWLQGY